VASIITLQNTVTWTQGYLFSQPVNLGAALEPAITNANIVKQAILGPPFCWRWNRKTPAAFALAQGVQDYSKAYADFSFLEKAWVSSGGATKEVTEIADVLSAESAQGRPDGGIAAQLDDNAGNITFRFTPGPSDNTWTAQLAYQAKATLFAALANTWTPIPDELSYIYQYGFLGMALAFNKDPRAQIYDARFIAHLLGCQGGLSEMQKNIFLGKWLSTAQEVGATGMRTRMGVEGRGQ
jgi:hypothetical protein